MATTEPRSASYRMSTSRSATLHKRATHVLPGGNSRTTVHLDPYPAYAERGFGAVIVDAEGVERLDFLNNYTSLIHGHADPDVNKAVLEQIGFGTAFAAPTDREIGLAELLVDRIPSVEQIRFTNSGTEAVMIAIQAARGYTDRPKIAKFEGCYHGTYDFAGVSTFTPAGDPPPGDPISYPYSFGTPQSVLDDVVVLRFNDIEMLERKLEEHRHELAAVLIDPMPLRIGMISAEKQFLERLRELCTTYGIVLIFDEVISLRAGYGGMQDEIGITPDLTTMAKIIGGGFPVGATGGSADVMAVFDPRGGNPKVQHGGTFSANPVTMVAGLAAMEKMTREEFARLDALGDYLREGLAEAMDGARIHGQVTGKGSLFNIHLHDRPLSDYRGSVPTPEEKARMLVIHDHLIDHAAVVSPALGGCLSTPMTETEANEFIDAFSAAMAAEG